MSILTAALYDHLAADGPLVALLAPYDGNPGIFTQHPVPGDAQAPYVVTVGEVTQLAWDTKTTRGRELIRDVRCYAPADGNVIVIEAIAERVRALLHRQELAIPGFRWIISNVTGPIAADERDYYARIVSVSLKAQED